MVLVIVIEIRTYRIIDYDYEHRCAEHEHDSRRQLCYLNLNQADFTNNTTPYTRTV